jgi:predicted dehydrogenase
MPHSLESRRDFLRASLAAGSLTAVSDLLADDRSKTSPNERLNVAVVGVSGRGAANLGGVGHENIVALCDVDQGHLDQARSKFPSAKGYADFREMLAAHPNVDAVVVSTPDHTHAVAAAAAMRLGKHVYCEKPMTHTVSETRVLRNLAKEKKLVTQLGTQIHAGENYRNVVDIIQSGAIGKVNRVHVYFSGRPLVFPKAAPKDPPKKLHYDLWVGPLEPSPYIPEQNHFNWRYWWKFGNGVLGDFGCHYMDLAFWALGLGAPKSVASTATKDHDGVNDVPGKQQVDYVFDGKDGDIHLTWRHGGDRPEEAAKFKFSNAVLFIGDQGMLAADYGHYKLLPEDKFSGYQVKRTIAKSIGHHKEWLNAIRTGGPTTCNFDYSGNLTEAVLLGNAAVRGAPGKTLAWDAASMKFSGDGADEANRFIQHAYRSGWSL